MSNSTINIEVSKLLYRPLSIVRLLRVPEGDDGNWHLEEFALNHPERPEFTAVSYFWGDAYRRKTMTIDGNHFRVLKSLYQFLELVTKSSHLSPDKNAHYTWWWIDSICLNQSNEDEVASQMPILGEIYSKAAETVVWLGKTVDENPKFEDSKDCTDAMKSMRYLNEMVVGSCNEDGKVPPAARLKFHRLRDWESGKIDWKPVERLLLRPWWTRVWTLQEFLLPRKLTFYCGDENLKKEEFKEAMYGIWLCEEHLNRQSENRLSRKAFASGWNRRRIYQWYKSNPDSLGLVAMLAYVGVCDASFPEDRVNSLLAFAKDVNIDTYQSKGGFEVVYRMLVESYIKTNNNLDIICFAHTFKNNSSPLPTWVPDWRVKATTIVVPLMASQGSKASIGNFRSKRFSSSSAAVYEAAGKTAPEWKITRDLRLKCIGVIIDAIDGLGGSRFKDAAHLLDEPDDPDDPDKKGVQLVKSESATNRSSQSHPHDSSELVKAIARSLVLNRKDKYLMEEAKTNTISHEFQDFCHAVSEARHEVDPVFRDWYGLNKSLRIGGHKLKKHCGRSESKSSSLDFRDDSKDTFLGRFKATVDGMEGMARRLVVTDGGHVGMAPSRAAQGDFICVLFGCNIPVALRREEDKPDGKKRYRFIGECYLDGFMNGKALERNPKEQAFHIV